MECSPIFMAFVYKRYSLSISVRIYMHGVNDKIWFNLTLFDLEW